MAQRSIEILIGRLVTDEAFRSAFRDSTTATLTRFMESGYELTPIEITALCATPAGVWERVTTLIDPRLQKASFAPPAATAGTGVADAFPDRNQEPPGPTRDREEES